jgi:hypothetical protein
MKFLLACDPEFFSKTTDNMYSTLCGFFLHPIRVEQWNYEEGFIGHFRH